ncbi:DUF2007 domain-containing protein [Pseudomarimonas salicorniae]|uniref:DUF2007 domain-containing protein n=1 Tax=Pseudomarimonas salicorniae TaxID=2933270 RepID=A0ABT0GE71_9GAMM|nr:DUF2007 domain-containing protein [Lysobacter sp. CAU 1642]MCK7592854.1 DUF2007 domain-containing protein [Lysobacter sp. CAU 1642]
MQVVYQAEHLIDAHLVRGRLQSEGIDAHVRGEWLTGALGELPLQGLLGVCVAERDVEAALALLATWQDEARREAEEERASNPDGGDDEDAGPDPDAAFLA